MRWPIFLALVLFTPDADDLRDLEGKIQKTIRDVRPAVVAIQNGKAGGSGCLISEDGWVATVAHAVGKRPGRPVVVTLADGTRLRGVTKGIHIGLDLGMIKVQPGGRKLPFAPLGLSRDLEKGQWLVAMGHPGGYVPGRPPVSRAGVIVRSKPDPDKITVDSPILVGDSGGPVFDLDGKLVAIIHANGPHSWHNIFTVVDNFRTVMDRMKAGEVMSRGSWGVELPFNPMNAADREKLKAANTHLQNGEKAEAEKLFDELDLVDYKSLVAAARAASTEKKASDLLLRAVAAGYDDFFGARKTFGDLKAVEDVRKALFRPFFEMKRKGLKIESVPKGSPAERAGFKAKQVIRKVNGKTVKNEKALLEALEEKGKLVFTLKKGEVTFSPRAKDHAQLPKADWKDGKNSLARWKKIDDVVWTVKVNGKAVVLATAVTENSLITKSSEITGETVLLVDGNGTEVEAEVAGRDSGGDLALLRVDRRIPFVALDGPEKKAGSLVATVGPSGIISQGIVCLANTPSNVRPRNLPRLSGNTTLSRKRTRLGRVIQHDGVLNSFEAGSPLVDLDGRVVGINIARFDRTSTYAHSAARVKSVLDRLAAGE